MDVLYSTPHIPAMTNEPRKDRRPPGRAEMIARVKQLARKRGVTTLTRGQIQHATGIGAREIQRYFDSHEALLDACNLRPHDRQASRTFAREAVLASEFRPVEARRPTLAAWKSCGGPRVGAPLNLPALRYAPTSEMGVVFLFGALAPSLGYVVERVGTRFPDCIALRRLYETGEPWEQVRIEFELRSRNFVTHKHDPKSCDVIVCWEDDWPECPLEVLELKREVAVLPAAPTGSGGGGDRI